MSVLRIKCTPEDPLATKEEITQTDILGLQQDLGDEPLQRPLTDFCF